MAKLFELLRQEYAGNGAVFSAGFVEEHPVDTMYIRFERPGEVEYCIALRPDEMTIVANLATGVLWSWLVEHVQDGQPMTKPPGGWGTETEKPLHGHHNERNLCEYQPHSKR
jgi:hypothetical protein